MELKQQQRRRVAVSAELRADNDRTILTGRPIVYNSWSLPIGGYFRERIMPGAFDEFLDGPHDLLCLRDHRDEYILGRESSKTLRVARDDKGITVECDAPRTTYGLDLVESVRRGDIRGMSFEFDVLDDNWHLEDGKRCRDVLKATLHEFSFLADPAYPATEAGVRDREQFEKEFAERLKPTNTELAWRRFKLLTTR